jgi:5-methylcytosine-specific restriction endonuclease McrA
MRKKSKKSWNLKSKLKSAFRRLFLFSPLHRDILARARIARGLYRCEICHALEKKLQVDHIKPVALAKDWNEYIDFLFCPENELQAICKTCHTHKTVIDNKNIKKAKNESNKHKRQFPKRL